MAANIKRIGVLTSGGDAPGMNAAVRAVVRQGLSKGIEVYGVHRGYAGLLAEEITPMDAHSVSDIISRGGTILQTARCLEFLEEEYQQKATDICIKHGLDAMVIIGGDGSYKGARNLKNHGFNTISLPGTIDLDIASTEYTIGFDTAVNTAMEAIDKIRDTAASHSRAYIIETMGRDCGYLAIQSAIVSGAECVLIPENPISIEEVASTIENAYKRGKKHCIILMAEGYPLKLDEVVRQLDAMDLGFTARGINLSYVQRGGSPSAFDRILASRMAFTAVD